MGRPPKDSSRKPPGSAPKGKVSGGKTEKDESQDKAKDHTHNTNGSTEDIPGEQMKKRRWCTCGQYMGVS